MTARFTWDDAKDRMLSGLWLTTEPDAIAATVGCGRRSIYKRAGELNLGPRDPAQRALWKGEKPFDRRVVSLAAVTPLPCCDDVPADYLKPFGATADEPARRIAGGDGALPAVAAGFHFSGGHR